MYKVVIIIINREIKLVSCLIENILSIGIVCLSDNRLSCGYPLYLNVFAVLGEVEHTYHSAFPLHSLRIHEELRNEISVNSPILTHNDVRAGFVSRKNHKNISMLRDELLPHHITVVFIGIAICFTVFVGRCRIVLINRCTITEHICVSCYDNSSFGVGINDAACPFKYLIVGTELKTKNHILDARNLEVYIIVIEFSFFIVTAYFLCIEIIVGICKIVIEVYTAIYSGIMIS